MASNSPAAETETPEPETAPSFEAARRFLESFLIAAVTSTGLYLVGSVYTDSYYGRMSIDATALDLSPPFIALQATHVVQGLLEYPIILLGIWAIYRFIASRLPGARSWVERAAARFGPVVLLAINLVIVAPIVFQAFRVGDAIDLTQTSSLLGEVSGLIQTAAAALLVYSIWLSFGPREVFLDQLRQRKVLPMALIFVLYLLDALVSTSQSATSDAELLMTGTSAASVAVTFTPTTGVMSLPSSELLLVTIRNGHYFVVERQPNPPSARPVAYAIPFRAVDSIRMQRVNDAPTIPELHIILGESTPAAP
jgi:hypothetical protein